MSLTRCAIIERATNRIVNVVEYEAVPVGDIPGFPGRIAIPHDKADQTWVWDGSNFMAPIAPRPTIADLRAYASQCRWQKEIGGIAFNGIQIPTDDRAKLLILGAAQTLADDATSPLIIGGVVYGSMTGAQFKALNAAIVAHVQATFSTLAAVLSGINDKSITTRDQVDAAFA